MSVPSIRVLRFAGIAIVVILLGLALYPGTLTAPHVTADDTPRYAHTIIPESAPQYDDVTEQTDPTVVRYDDLSPIGQELFDRTRAAAPRPHHNGERRFIPDVCRDFLLVCDSYSEDELPEEFTYGTELTYEESFRFIEHNNDRYLFQTGITGHLFFAPFPVGFVLAWLTMLPLAIFVALVTNRSTNPRILGATVGGGALVAILGFSAPYIEMAGLVSTWTIGVVLLSGVWISILAAGGYTLYHRVADTAQ